MNELRLSYLYSVASRSDPRKKHSLVLKKGAEARRELLHSCARYLEHPNDSLRRELKGRQSSRRHAFLKSDPPLYLRAGELGGSMGHRAVRGVQRRRKGVRKSATYFDVETEHGVFLGACWSKGLNSLVAFLDSAAVINWATEPQQRFPMPLGT